LEYERKIVSVVASSVMSKIASLSCCSVVRILGTASCWLVRFTARAVLSGPPLSLLPARRSPREVRLELQTAQQDPPAPSYPVHRPIAPPIRSSRRPPSSLLIEHLRDSQASEYVLAPVRSSEQANRLPCSLVRLPLPHPLTQHGRQRPRPRSSPRPPRQQQQHPDQVFPPLRELPRLPPRRPESLPPSSRRLARFLLAQQDEG
jgi:hypothetical protein